MRKTNWSVQDAKNKFSALIRAAHRAPQTITRHGKPEVVVVDAARFEELRRLERLRAPSFTELLLAIPRDDGEFERLDVRPRGVDF